MIFAAGLGTRLRPLTNDKPKALVEVDGMPLLEIAIRRLKYFGITDIIINIHHFGDLILSFLERHNNFDINIQISDERALLLNTGGGLKKAAWFLQDAPFLLFNTDIISNVDLPNLMKAHLASGALATLATRQRDTSRYFLFNETNRLVGWTNVKTGEIKLPVSTDNYTKAAFSGIHAISPAIFDFMPAEDVFSIVDVYLNTANTAVINGYPHDSDSWLDVGKHPQLKQAPQFLTGLELA